MACLLLTSNHQCVGGSGWLEETTCCPVDGIDVSIMLASDVSRLVLSRRGGTDTEVSVFETDEGASGLMEGDHRSIDGWCLTKYIV
jgi:hypothetical protein